jgi:hypothetical protein
MTKTIHKLNAKRRTDGGRYNATLSRDRASVHNGAAVSMSVSRMLIGVGIILIVVGLAWPLIQKLGLGRLPGDIVIERDNFRFYLPITTSILISVLLSLIVWLLRK